jgi:hypothetical protein
MDRRIHLSESARCEIKDNKMSYHEKRYYAVGFTDNELIGYDDMKDWRFIECHYLTCSPSMLEEMTWGRAEEFIKKHGAEIKAFFKKETELKIFEIHQVLEIEAMD